MILLPSQEPLFASREERKGKFIVYYDQDGLQACANFSVTSNPRLCSICRNCCVVYHVNEDSTYTCSACGKFPREALLS